MLRTIYKRKKKGNRISCNNVKCHCFVAGLSLFCHFPTYRAGAKMSLVI